MPEASVKASKHVQISRGQPHEPYGNRQPSKRRHWCCFGRWHPCLYWKAQRHTTKLTLCFWAICRPWLQVQSKSLMQWEDYFNCQEGSVHIKHMVYAGSWRPDTEQQHGCAYWKWYKYSLGSRKRSSLHLCCQQGLLFRRHIVHRLCCVSCTWRLLMFFLIT